MLFWLHANAAPETETDTGVSPFLTLQQQQQKKSDPQIPPPTRQRGVCFGFHNSKLATVWSPKAEHPQLRTALHNTDMQHRQRFNMQVSAFLFLTCLKQTWKTNLNHQLQLRI